MAVINLTLPNGELPITGKQVTFVSPCKSDAVKEISVNGDNYLLVDAIGEEISDNAFNAGVIVSVILDYDNKKAFIQNPTSSKSVENSISNSVAKTKYDLIKSVRPLNLKVNGKVYPYNSRKKVNLSVAPAYESGTKDIEAGVTRLDKGTLYFVYEGDSNELINIHVNGETFTVEKGTTWAEWISKWARYSVVDSKVLDSDSNAYLLDIDGNILLADSIIKEGSYASAIFYMFGITDHYTALGQIADTSPSLEYVEYQGSTFFDFVYGDNSHGLFYVQQEDSSSFDYDSVICTGIFNDCHVTRLSGQVVLSSDTVDNGAVYMYADESECLFSVNDVLYCLPDGFTWEGWVQRLIDTDEYGYPDYTLVTDDGINYYLYDLLRNDYVVDENGNRLISTYPITCDAKYSTPNRGE